MNATIMLCALCWLSAQTPAVNDPSAPTALTLQETIERVSQRGGAVGNVEAQVALAEWQALRAQLDRINVTLDFRVSEVFNTTNIGGPVPPGSSNVLLGLSNLDGNVQVPLFTGFRITHNVTRTRALEAAAQADLADAKRQVAASVVQAYWSIRRSEAVIAAQRAALAQLENSEALVQKKVAAGLAPDMDASRAAVRRLDVVASLKSLEASVLEARAELAQLAGATPAVVLSEPFLPAAALEKEQALTSMADVEAWVDARGDVRAAKARAEARLAEVSMAYAEFYPQLALFGRAQVGNNPLLAGAGTRAFIASPNPFAGLAGDVQAGATLSINLFDHLRSLQALREAEARKQAADAVARGAKLQANAEAARFFAREQGLRERRETIVALAQLAQDNLAVLSRAYDRGDLALDAFLDAAVTAANAEAQRVDIEARITEARALLLCAAGHCGEVALPSAQAGATPTSTSTSPSANTNAVP